MKYHISSYLARQRAAVQLGQRQEAVAGSVDEVAVWHASWICRWMTGAFTDILWANPGDWEYLYK